MCERRNRSLGIKFPYNWDFDLIRGLAEVNADADTMYPIDELYCSDPWSLLGSGRPGAALHQRLQDYGSYVAEAQLGITPTDAVLPTAFATMLTDQAGGLFMRQVAAGSPIGELPLLGGVFELPQVIAGPGGGFSGVDTLPDVGRQSEQRQCPAHLGGRHAESFGDLLAVPAVQFHQGHIGLGLFDRFEVVRQQVFDQLLFQDFRRGHCVCLEVALDRR